MRAMSRKITTLYVDKLNPRYAVDASAEAKRQLNETWQALNLSWHSRTAAERED